MDIHPSQFKQGTITQEAAIRHLRRMVDDLKKRVEALEAKRGPGRPPKEKEAA